MFLNTLKKLSGYTFRDTSDLPVGEKTCTFHCFFAICMYYFSFCSEFNSQKASQWWRPYDGSSNHNENFILTCYIKSYYRTT